MTASTDRPAVTDNGTGKSIFTRWTPPLERFWAQAHHSSEEECWPWLGTTNDAGYGQIGVHGRTTYAHRFAYETLVAPIESGLVIDHLCGNPSCVNPDHLEAVPQAINVRRGRLTRLSEEEVEAIREASGTQTEIAMRFGVCSSYVSMVKSGRRRAEVAA